MRSRLLAFAVLLACASALRAEDKFYQVNLAPSGSVISKGLPVTKGQMVVFYEFPSGTLVSYPRASVKSVLGIASNSAHASNVAEQVIPIGNLAMQGGASQGGPTNARAVNQPKPAANTIGGPGFYNNLVPGQSEAMPNSANDYQVGRTFAYGPANATQSSAGDVPTAPSMTNGQNPPQ